VWGQGLLSRLGAGSIPRLGDSAIDVRVLLFTLAISLLSGVLFGLVPALHAVRSPIEPSLREGGRGAAGDRRGRAIRSGLIVAEVALALILLVGAGLMMRSFSSLRGVNPGFDPASVLTMYLAPPESKYDDVPKTTALFDQILERARATGDVTAAGATSRLPLAGGSWGKYLTVEGRPAHDLRDVAQVTYEIVTPGDFSALSIRLVRGREFAGTDVLKSQAVAIVNEAAARELFPGEDPVGRRIRLAPPEGLLPDDALPEGVVIPWMTIVGIAGDVRSGSLRRAAGPLVYAPLAQNADNPVPMYLAVRTSGDPLALTGAIRSQVWAVDRDLPVSAVAPMSAVLADSISRPRFSLFLLGLFAAVALALSALGIYGVTAYAVSQRTREIGVRMALGARSRDVLSMVLREEMKLALAGVAIGVAGSFALTRLMSSLLFGVTPTDPLTFAVVPALVILAGIASSLGPARRAASVDPAVALRWE
jgi:putative ABC transport system permease protein